MDLLRDILLILHFVGLASLLGGFLYQLSARKFAVNSGMFHGVLTQLVTGIALAGIISADDDIEANHMKIGVKLLITIVVAALVFIYRRRESVATPVWWAIGGLTLANICVAVIW